MTPANRTQTPPVFSIALLSASALAYEILLMRMFSIIQWHYFAYMIISLALLGYGVSGAFLSITQRWLLPRFPAVFLTNCVLFGLAAVGCYLAAQAVPFNPEEVLWDLGQWLRLLIIYLLLALPFFFAANGVALAFMRFRNSVSRVYAFDLTGAGIGSLGIILLLFAVFPLDALAALGGMGILAAAVAARELGLRPRVWIAMAVLAVLLPAVLVTSSLHFTSSPYKGLNQILRITGTKIIAERSSPLGLIAVVESPLVPLRHAPGLSLNATTEPPPQLGLFTDGDGMTAITQHTDDRARLAYLDQMTSAAPYHLIQPQRVLILGAGGGSEILQARYHHSQHIEAVELNPQIVDLIRKDYRSFTGGLYDAEGVRIHVAEARGFVVGSNERFDLIQVALLDTFGASSAGLYALSESYLYSVEALQAYLRHLLPDGYLAISRWIKLPPRDTLKLFATAVEALTQSGVSDAAQRLLLIRGWQTSTLLIKNGIVSNDEITALRRFSAARAFDLAYYPGMQAHEANRHNQLQQPYFFLGAKALLGAERDDFIDRYKFNLQPATDDRPYFFHFFKWRVLPEILELRGQGGMPLMEWGYLVLVATLLQAVAASLVLILLPLWFYRRRKSEAPFKVGRGRVFVYFFVVGMAFLFIEIAFIQKFILFLHHPLYAVAVVLSGFLLFAGMGSAWSRRQVLAGRHRRGVILAVVGIVLLSIGYIAALGPLFDLMLALPVAIKILISIVLIAPLAFCMGMPFPLALASLGESAPAIIPWAWGVNGCASVLSAVLATLLAIHFGFTIVVLLASLLYGVAVAAFPRESTVSKLNKG